MEEKIQTIADRIATMQTRQIETMVSEIAKQTKKKKITSGNLFFKDYCRKIAEFVVNRTTIVQKYNLA